MENFLFLKGERFITLTFDLLLRIVVTKLNINPSNNMIIYTGFELSKPDDSCSIDKKKRVIDNT